MPGSRDWETFVYGGGGSSEEAEGDEAAGLGEAEQEGRQVWVGWIVREPLGYE